MGGGFGQRRDAESQHLRSVELQGASRSSAYITVLPKCHNRTEGESGRGKDRDGARQPDEQDNVFLSARLETGQ